MNIAFAYADVNYALSTATFSTTGGAEIEQNKKVGHLTTIMRLLTNKVGIQTSYFDKKYENQYGIKGFSINKFLFDNLEQLADQRNFKGH